MPNPFEKKPKTHKEKIIDKVRSSDYTKPYAVTDSVYQNLNGAIVAMADQLFVSNTFREKKPSLILTSFVELNELDKTTTFGRMLSESMFNELHIRNFHVTDFRGQNAVSVNADGEFHITRDVDRLKDHISATEYIVVGTYVKFEHESVLLNARILDSETGSIISTARVIYKPEDCTVYDLCFEPVRPDDYGIELVKDRSK
jgi:TolB-like protein